MLDLLFMEQVLIISEHQQTGQNLVQTVSVGMSNQQKLWKKTLKKVKNFSSVLQGLKVYLLFTSSYNK